MKMRGKSKSTYAILRVSTVVRLTIVTVFVWFALFVTLGTVNHITPDTPKLNILFNALLPSLEDISPVLLGFIGEIACKKTYSVHLLVDKRPEGDLRSDIAALLNCGVLLDYMGKELDTVMQMQRVDKIAFLRSKQMELNRKRAENFDVVVILDCDLEKYPTISSIERSSINFIVSGRYDALASNGVMFRPYGYYDTFATIFYPDTWSYSVADRKNKVRLSHEDVSLIRGDTEFTGTTTRHLEEMIASSVTPLLVRSAFGGLTLYRSSAFFGSRCSYIAGNSQLVSKVGRYANRDDGRPCEHVVLHECLRASLPDFRMAIDPTLVTWWNSERSALVLWPTLPVVDLKGSDTRILEVIQFLVRNNYQVDLCVWRDIADECGQEMADRVRKMNFPGVRNIWTNKCWGRHDFILLWPWPDLPYLDWLRTTVERKMSREVPPKLIVGLDDEGLALRDLEGWCVKCLECACKNWTQSDRINALRKFPDFYQGVEIPARSKEIWDHESFLYQTAKVRFGITSRTIHVLDTVFPGDASFRLPYVARSIETTSKSKSFAQRKGVLFTGYRNFSNKFAVQWLLQKVLPLIKEIIHICGLVDVPAEFCTCTHAGKCISNHPQVICHGWVSDQKLDEITRGVLVAVNPSLERAGIATKTIYAMLRGTPVISTEMDGTFNDIPLTGGAYICNSFDEVCMTKRILELTSCARMWNKYSKDAPKYVEKAFGQQNFDKAMRKALDTAWDMRQRLLIVGDALRNEWSIPSQNWLITSTLSKEFDVTVLGKMKPRISRVKAYLKLPTTFMADIVFVHSWPPAFDLDTSVFCGFSCRVVLLLPWEFGSLPKKWVAIIRNFADEVWAPSEANQKALIDSGIDRMHTRIIPCIVKCADNEDITRYTQKKSQDSKIKFVMSGGLLPRKGVDVLLIAWSKEFCDGNTADTELVLHTSYGLGYSKEDLIGFQSIIDKCNNIKWLRNSWIDSSDYQKIVQEADVYVGVSRAEGFGLPFVEALTRGQQVISTARGAASDYLDSKVAYTVNGEETICRIPPCSYDGRQLCVIPPCVDGKCRCIELVGYATWIEPDVDATRKMLVQVYRDLQEEHPRLDTGSILAYREKYCYRSFSVQQRWSKAFQSVANTPRQRGHLFDSGPVAKREIH